MNYIKQGISFFELQLSNQISANAQALYYTLLNINNKCNWKERFTVANSMLTAYTDLNTSAIQRARNELIQLGVIDYKKGKGNQCGEYLLFKLYPDFEQQTDSNVNDKPITNRQQCERQTDTLYKQNKTKQDETKQNNNQEVNNISKKESVKEKSKTAYGDYAHVLLSDEEYDLLVSEYGEFDTEEIIDFLDEKIEANGYKYNNCYLKIKEWAAEAYLNEVKQNREPLVLFRTEEAKAEYLKNLAKEKKHC